VPWSTDPGNSAPPPAGPLPEYMAVIVTSSAAKSGAAISGNTVHIVIVKTNAGYAPDPGHAGTGTVISQVC
jgi:folate-dependent phosphoribosylglycinamide formyltransferase PurN